MGIELKKILQARVYNSCREDKGANAPTIPQVFEELIDSINFVKDKRRLTPALILLFHVATFLAFVLFVVRFFNLPRLLCFGIFVLLQVNVYNTFWFHRFCSHKAFKFKRPNYALLFLWTNPFFFREESYALPHWVHHALSDSSDDPYGPHLGWLGSYFSQESVQKINTRALSHIYLRANSYEDFKKQGSFESVASFFVRAIFAQIVWIILTFIWGRLPMVVTWYSALFLSTFLIRDFNWRGHRGSPNEFGDKSSNQMFYGLIASEWHANHHAIPNSANNAVEPQFDLVFNFIKFLKKLNFVKAYSDDYKKLDK